MPFYEGGSSLAKDECSLTDDSDIYARTYTEELSEMKDRLVTNKPEYEL